MNQPLFFRPTSALWWLYCAAVAIAAVYVTVKAAPSLAATTVAVGAVLPLILITGALFAFLALVLDPFGARRPWLLVLAVLGGATIPAAVSLKGNEYISGVVIQMMGTEMGSAWESAFAGPITEEWSKGLTILLIMLIAGHVVARPIHGLVIGAFVGLGFQVIENVLYAANGALGDANSDLNGAWTTTVIRAVVGVSSHWVLSAMVGVAVVLLLRRRVAAGIGLFVLAWALHFMWNAPLLGDPVGIFLKVVVILAVFAVVVGRVWRSEREFLRGRFEGFGGDATPAPAPVVPDGAARGAFLSGKERRAFLKQERKEHGRSAVKASKKQWRELYRQLQGS
ncbi:MAG TPA: PrsW family intramembrane metalloprotease [Candidatus Corynebacterium gallistercoris]|uniref:PrsW family intramembrane metalloprotease n=1 Tax=Candidatus Corynebacterium gallistercoris TaxID=2838530 RepID=A0A9D1UQC6_9CORY|nr:PrsW family intramembrane metalloprotease [Candidatus Corynebacterium gallistercoris]